MTSCYMASFATKAYDSRVSLEFISTHFVNIQKETRVPRENRDDRALTYSVLTKCHA